MEQISMDFVNESHTHQDEDDEKKSISHFDIFDYWKDKAITDSGKVIKEIGYGDDDYNKNFDISRSITVVTDWGEPRCFACDKFAPFAKCLDEETQSHDFDFKKLWNQSAVRHSFEKAHILPKALGGKVRADNMFILCRDCHKESPDTIYKEEFFRWVYRKRHEGSKIQKAILLAFEQLSKDGIPFMPNTELEFGKSINSHGGGIVSSTYTAAIVGSARENYDAMINFIRKTSGNVVAECVNSEIKDLVRKHYSNTNIGDQS